MNMRKKKTGPGSHTPFLYVCSGCGQVLYHRARASDRQFGSPMRPCPSCGTEYYDPHYREPALCRGPKLPMLPGTVWGGLLMGAAFLLGALYMPQKLELALFGLLFFCVSAWFAWDYRRTLPQRQEELEEELKRSRKRLENPNYRKKLESHGVKVK